MTVCVIIGISCLFQGPLPDDIDANEEQFRGNSVDNQDENNLLEKLNESDNASGAKDSEADYNAYLGIEKDAKEAKVSFDSVQKSFVEQSGNFGEKQSPCGAICSAMFSR